MPRSRQSLFATICALVCAFNSVPNAYAQLSDFSTELLETVSLRFDDGGVRDAVYFDYGSGPRLIAAGSFQSAGGEAIRYIAEWDGDRWQPFGGGVTGPVYDLEVFDDGSGPALFVAGRFRHAGGQVVNSVARWDGSAWSAVGSGFSSSGWCGNSTYATVKQLEIVPWDDGLGLMAVGDIEEASCDSEFLSFGVSVWNGQSWASQANVQTEFGFGDLLTPNWQGICDCDFDSFQVDEFIYSVRLHVVAANGATYLLWTGDFQLEAFDGDTFATFEDFAALSQGSWSSLGGGPPVGTTVFLGPLDSPDQQLHAAGFGGLASWNGSKWSIVRDDISFRAGDVIPEELQSAYLIGRQGPFGDYSYAMYSWDGVVLEEDLELPDRGRVVRRDLNCGVLFAIGNPDLDLPRGPFEFSVSDKEFEPFVQESGLSGSVRDVAGGLVADDELVVALVSHSSRLNGHELDSGLIRWTGSDWVPFSEAASGLFGTAVDVVDVGAGGVLMVGRSSTTASDRLLAWDGASWSAVGDGLGQSGTNRGIRQMVPFRHGEDQLVCVAGTFEEVNGEPAEGFAIWDGSSFFPIPAPETDLSPWTLRLDVAELNGQQSVVAIYRENDTAFFDGGTGEANAFVFDGDAWQEVFPDLDIDSSFWIDDNYAVAGIGSGPDSGIYVSGVDCSGDSIISVAKWNGTDWTEIPLPQGSVVSDLFLDCSTLRWRTTAHLWPINVGGVERILAQVEVFGEAIGVERIDYDLLNDPDFESPAAQVGGLAAVPVSLRTTWLLVDGVWQRLPLAGLRADSQRISGVSSYTLAGRSGAMIFGDFVSAATGRAGTLVHVTEPRDLPIRFADSGSILGNGSSNVGGSFDSVSGPVKRATSTEVEGDGQTSSGKAPSAGPSAALASASGGVAIRLREDNAGVVRLALNARVEAVAFGMQGGSANLTVQTTNEQFDSDPIIFEVLEQGTFTVVGNDDAIEIVEITGSINADQMAVGTYGLSFNVGEFLSGGGVGVSLVTWTLEFLPESAGCPSDVTGDGSVDLADLNLVLAGFGGTGEGDATGDGLVDLADLNVILAAFGTTCP